MLYLLSFFLIVQVNRPPATMRGLHPDTGSDTRYIIIHASFCLCFFTLSSLQFMHTNINRQIFRDDPSNLGPLRSTSENSNRSVNERPAQRNRDAIRSENGNSAANYELQHGQPGCFRDHPVSGSPRDSNTRLDLSTISMYNKF